MLTPGVGRSYKTLGYRIGPIIRCAVLTFILMLVIVGMGFSKFPSSMPVVESCSLVIAAACHPPKDDTDAAVLPVQWGDTQRTSPLDIAPSLRRTSARWSSGGSMLDGARPLKTLERLGSDVNYLLNG